MKIKIFPPAQSPTKVEHPVNDYLEEIEDENINDIQMCADGGNIYVMVVTK